MRLKKRRKGFALAAALTALEAFAVKRRRGSLFGWRTIVRCRKGHLFATVWIPGASFKAMRLGLWRLQRCPVGRHWSLVTPVKASKLSGEERDRALSQRDTRIP